jgi:hypothetical protein
VNDAFRKEIADPGTYGAVLLTIAADRFGPESVGVSEAGAEPIDPWDPATFALEFKAEFGVELPEENFNRLNAAVELFTTDHFYKDHVRFIELCNALFDGRVTPGVFDKADALECAWGINEALLIAPPEAEDEEPFSPEVVAYVRQAVRDEGIYQPPDVLKIANLDDDYASVQGNWSDDPNMFGAMHQVQRGKAAEISMIVRDRMRDLLGRLERLRFSGSGPAEFARGLLARLPSDDELASR